MTEIKWEENFKAFLKQYYWDDILQLANEYPDQRSLTVDFSNLEIFDRELAAELLEQPSEVLPSADKALQEIDLP
jgi:replicative DNA helicase Mcm